MKNTSATTMQVRRLNRVLLWFPVIAILTLTLAFALPTTVFADGDDSTPTAPPVTQSDGSGSGSASQDEAGPDTVTDEPVQADDSDSVSPTQDEEVTDSAAADGQTEDSIDATPSQDDEVDNNDTASTEDVQSEDDGTESPTQDEATPDPAPVDDSQSEDGSTVSPSQDEVTTDSAPTDDLQVDEAATEPDSAPILDINDVEPVLAESEPEPEPLPASVLDPYFYVAGVPYVFLPTGGNCGFWDPIEPGDCTTSDTPIQAAIDAAKTHAFIDSNTIYIEDGTYSEDITIDGLSKDLTLRGSGATTLSGSISISDNGTTSTLKIQFISLIFTNTITASCSTCTTAALSIGLEDTTNATLNMNGDANDNLFELSIKNGSGNIVNMDGAGGSDTYSATVGGNATINVNDTGSSGSDMLTVFGSGGADTLHLNAASVSRDEGGMVAFTGIESINVDGGNGQDVIYVDETIGYNSIVGGEAKDTLYVQHDIIRPGEDITIDVEVVTVSAGIVISTRQISGIDYLNGISTGDSGNITISGDTITFESGAMLLAHTFSIEQTSSPSDWTANQTYTITLDSGMVIQVVTDGSGVPTVTLLQLGVGNGDGDTITINDPGGVGSAVTVAYHEVYAPGDVAVSACDTSWTGIPLLDWLQSNIFSVLLGPKGVFINRSSVEMTDTTVRGGNVSISSYSEYSSQSFLQELFDGIFFGDLLNTVYDMLFGQGLIPLPLGFNARVASSIVEILGNSHIEAQGNVEVDSNALADASLQVKSTLFAIALGLGLVDSKALVGGNTVVTAAGDVLIRSGASDTAEALARTLTDHDAASFTFCIALVISRIESLASVTENAMINSGRNVNVLSSGVNATSADATFAIYKSKDGKDGVGGFTLSLVFPYSDVTATVAGTITAVGSSGTGTFENSSLLSFDTGNISDSVIEISGHGFQNGDWVIYRSGGGDSVGGLEDGQSYSVIVIDENHIKLASASAIDLDASGVLESSIHSLRLSLVKEFDPSVVIKQNTGTGLYTDFSITNHGFQNGQVLSYSSLGNDPIEISGGILSTALGNGEEFYVIYVDANTFQLARTGGGTPIEMVPPTVTGKHVFSYLDATLTETFNTTTDIIETTPGSGIYNRISIPGHNFVDGQVITYSYLGNANAGEQILELDEGGNYFIVGADATSFQLATSAGGTPIQMTIPTVSALHGFTYIDAAAVTTFTPSTDVDSDMNTITIPGHGLETGDVVYYEVDPSVIVTRQVNQYYSVDPTVTFDAGDPDQTQVVDYAGNRIRIDNHGLANGTQLVYEANGESPIIGLIDGTTYFVVNADTNYFQLSLTSGGAARPLDAGGTMVASPHTFRLLRNVDFLDPSVGGLESGQYYFVVKIDNDTIALADSFEIAQNAAPITLDLSVATGDNHGFDTGLTSGIGIKATLENSVYSQAWSGVGGEPGWYNWLTMPELAKQKVIFGGIKKIYNWLTSAAPQSGAGTQPSTWGLAGAVNFVYSDQTVLAEVGSTAVLKTGQHLQVVATLSDTIQYYSEAAIAKEQDQADKGAISATVIVGIYDNNVKAIIQSGAQTDASRDTNLYSSAMYPFVTEPTWRILVPWDTEAGWDYDSIMSNVGDLPTNVGNMLDNKLGIGSKLFNTWSHSVCNAEKAPDVSIAGSVNFQYLGSSSQAIIGAGAWINQDTDYQTDFQTVSVVAETGMRYIDVTGNLDLNLTESGVKEFKKKGPISFVNLPGKGGKGGMGGAFYLKFIDNDTIAKIERDALVHTGVNGSLDVNASTDVFQIAVTNSGGNAGSFGLAGTFTFIKLDNYTLAQIEGGAQITGNNVNVTADDKLFLFNLGGGFVKGNNIGIGVTIGINLITRETYALIGNLPDGERGPWEITFNGNGDQSQITATALPAYNGVLEPSTITEGGVETQEVQRISHNATQGDVIFTYKGIDTTSLPYNASAQDVQNALNALSSMEAGGVIVTGGEGDAWLIQFVNPGNAPLITARGANGFNGTDGACGTSTALTCVTSTSGSLNTNEVQQISQASRPGTQGAFTLSFKGETTLPLLYNASAADMQAALNALPTISAAGGVTVTKAGDLWTITFNVAGARDQIISAPILDFNGNFTWTTTNGSGSSQEVQILSHDANRGAFTLSFGGQTTKPLPYDASLEEIQQALNALASIPAGGVSVTSGSGGSPLIDTIDITGDLNLDAKNEGLIITISLAASVITDQDKREPAGESADDALDGLSLPILFEEQEPLNKTKNGIAISGDISVNIITEKARAYISDSGNVFTGGAINLSALNNTINVVVAGSAAISAAGEKNSMGIAGSVGVNVINDETRSLIQGTQVQSSGGLTMSAERGGALVAVTAGGAGAPKQKGIAVAGSVSVNVIDNETEALIDNASVKIIGDTSDTSLTADDNTLVIVVAGAVAYGGKAGVGAGLAVNVIDNEIRAKATDVTFEHDGALDLSAIDNSDIIAVVAAGGISGDKLGLAFTIAVNVIHNTVEAVLANFDDTGNTVLNGAVSLYAKGEAMIISIAGAVGAAKNTGIGAALAFNFIINDVNAYIENGLMNMAGNLTLYAEQASQIWSASAGGAGGEKIGIAAAVSVNEIAGTVDAHIKDSNIQTSGTVSLTAKDTSDIRAAAGNVAIAGKAAVGASIGFNGINKIITAYIDNSQIISTAGDILIHAISSASIYSFAAGGQASGKVAVGGSVVVTEVTTDTSAYIENSTVEADGSVVVSALNDLFSLLVAGVVNGAGTAAVGVSNTTFVEVEMILAYIGTNSRVKGKGKRGAVQVYTGARDSDGNLILEDFKGVAVTAVSGQELYSFAVGGSIAGQVSVAGSATVNVLTETTKAYIVDGVIVNEDQFTNSSAYGTNNSVNVLAANDTELVSVAGALSVGIGTAGIGAGVDVGVVVKDTWAYIGAATVNAAGDVTVQAQSSEQIVSVSASLGIGGTVGVAGSASVYTVVVSTRAWIGDDPDGTVTSGVAYVTANDSVLVSALEHTDGILIAGNIAGGGTVGVGVAFEVPVIVKTTEAFIGPGSYVTGNGNGDGVRAYTGHFDVTWTPDPIVDFNPATTRSGSTINVGFNHGWQTGQAVVYSNGTDENTGSIGGLSNGQVYYVIVTGPQSIRLAATQADALAGNFITLTSNGTGTHHTLKEWNVASVDRDLFNPATAVDDTNHTIDLGYAHGYTTGQPLVYSKGPENGNVSLEGLEDGQTYYAIVVGGSPTLIKLAATREDAFAGNAIPLTKTGAVGTDHSLWDGIIEKPAAPVHTPGPQVDSSNTDLDGDGIADLNPNEQGLTQQRASSAQTTTIKGVAVSAINQDRLITVTASAGGSGTVSVNVSGTVHVLVNTVRAFIDNNAHINDDLTDASSEQSVLVAAGNDFYLISVTFTGAISGVVSVTPGALVTVVRNVTQAFIDDGAVVKAMRDVWVLADAGEWIVAVAAGVSGSGTVAVGGAISVIVVVNETLAYIGTANSTSGATVDAGGNVWVDARDNTSTLQVAGSLGIGIGAVGVGASIGVIVLNKTTQAFIGPYSVVNGKGLYGSLDNLIFSGEIDEDGNFLTLPTFRGVAVQASSREWIFNLAASGAGGFYAGVAGGVAVEIDHSDTTAYIGAYADVNKDQTGVDAAQSVNVSAVNYMWVFAFGGGIAGGIAGVSGGIDVGVARNDVNAWIGDYAEVFAAQDVDINALASKYVRSIAVSIAGGIVGVAGSVSVWAIGTAFDPNYSFDEEDKDGNVTTQTENTLNTDGGDDEFNNTLNGTDNLSGGFQDQVDAYGAYPTGGDTPDGDPTTPDALNDDPVTLPKDSTNNIINILGNDDFGDSGAGSNAISIVNGPSYGVASVDDNGTPNDPSDDTITYTPTAGYEGTDSLTYQICSANGQCDTAAVSFVVSSVPNNGYLLGQYSGQTGQSMFSYNPNGSISGALNASGDAAKSGINAWIGQHATVSTGGSVGVRAKEMLNVYNVAGSLSLGAGAFGGGFVVVYTSSHTQAFIDDYAIVTAGADLTDNIVVEASLDETVNGLAIAGAMSAGMSLGAQVVVLVDDSTQNAFIDNNAEIWQAGGTLKVLATADRSVTARAVGVALAYNGFAVGASVAIATLGGETLASIGDALIGKKEVDTGGLPVGDGTEIGETTSYVVRQIEVQAEAIADVLAHTVAVAGGLAAGLSGAVSVAIFNPTVTARIGLGADIETSWDIDLTALVEADVAAEAEGVSLSTGVSGGASVAVAQNEPTITVAIENANVIAGEDITLQALFNCDENHTPLDKGSNALAVGVSGAIFAAAQATAAVAHTAPVIDTYIASGAVIDASGTVTLLSQAYNDAYSMAVGVGVGAVAAAGTGAESHVSGQVWAHIGNASLDANSLDVKAWAVNEAYAEVDAGAGGLATLALNFAYATIDPDIDAYINSTQNINTPSSLSITAQVEANGYAKALGISVSGGVQMGASVAETTIEPTIDAYLKAVRVRAGDITIQSLFNVNQNGAIINNADGNPKGAYSNTNSSGGGYWAAGNGADSDSSVQPTIKTYIEGAGLDLIATGAVIVRTWSSHMADAYALGVTLGGAAGVGVTLADAISDATITTRVGSTSLTGTQFKAASLTVETKVTDAARTEADLGSGSLFASVGVATATSTGESQANSYLTGINSVVITGDALVTASVTPDLFAKTYGVVVGGAVGVGASVSTATASPVVTAYVSGSDIRAANLTVSALQSLPTDGESATAETTAAGGSLIGSVNAAEGNASNTGQVTSYIANNASLVITGATIVAAVNNNYQHAKSLGAAAGVGLAVGVSLANATSDTQTDAYLGTGVHLTGNGNLTVTATGMDSNYAETTAGSGGLVSGNASVAKTEATSTLSAKIKANGVFQLSSLIVSGLHTTGYASSADSVNASLVGASGAKAQNTANATVDVTIGNSVSVNASQKVEISSENRFNQLDHGNSVTAAAGGGITATAALSETTLTGSSNVTLGNSISINAGQNGIMLTAASRLVHNDVVDLATGGAINGAGVNSTVTATLNNNVTLGTSVSLISTGNIGIGTYTNGFASSEADVSTWGLAAVGVAIANTTVTTNQTVTIGDGIAIAAFGNVNIMAGNDPTGAWQTDLSGNSSAQGYVRGLIAIPDASATTTLTSNTTVTIGTGNIGSGQHTRLGGFPGIPSALADGTGHGYELGFIPVTTSDSNPSSHITSTLVLNATVVAGIYHELTITIPDCGNSGVFCSTINFNSSAAPFTFNFYPNFDAATFAEENLGATAFGEMISTTPVGAFVLGSLFASGGSVTINANALSGTGSVTAWGGPTITVTNASPDYLVIGSVTIPDIAGGQVVFTGAAQSGISVNEQNPGVGGSIQIANNYDGSVGNSDQGPALFLMGDISNLSGAVQITNLMGSLGQAGAIDAQQVNIDVPNGLVSINHTGYYSTGSSPYAVWKNYMIWPGGNPSTATNLSQLNTNVAISFVANAEHTGYASSYDLTHHLIGYAGDSPPNNFSVVYVGGCLSFVGAAASYCTSAVADAYFSTTGVYSNSGSTEWNHSYFPIIPLQTLTRTGTAANGDTSGSAVSALNAAAIIITAGILDINSQVNAGRPTDWSLVLDAADGITLSAYKIAYDLFGFLGINPIRDLADLISTANFTDSEITARYDATTNQIIVDKVGASSRGGFIQIDAKVISTTTLGNIHVNSGFGNVDIQNNTGIALVLDNIYAGSDLDISASIGRIDIIDRNLPNTTNHTLYKFVAGEGITVYQGAASTSYTDLELTTPVATIAGTSASYQTVAGLRWEWKMQATLSRNVYYSSGTWTASNWTWNTPAGTPNNPWQYYDYSTYSYTTTSTGHLITDPGGAAFEQTIIGDAWDYYSINVHYHDCGSNNICNYGFRYTNPADSTDSRPYGNWQYQFPRDASITMTMSVKADNPIGLAFAGTSRGTVSIVSNASVILNGKITNPNGDTSISVSNGSLTQSANGSIVSNNLTITAPNGNVGTPRQVISVVITDNGILQVRSNRQGIYLDLDGDARISQMAAWNTYTYFDIFKFQIVTITQYGDVNIHTSGSLTASGAGVHITGRNITITSDNGGVGAIGTPLVIGAHPTATYNGRVYDGIVTISALGDIAITQEVGAGDLWINRIVSNGGGDIYINVLNGRLLDASGRTSASILSEDQLQAIWQRLNLLVGGDQQLEAVEKFEAQVKTQYEAYWRLVNAGLTGSDEYATTAAFFDNLYGNTDWIGSADFTTYNSAFAHTATATQVSGLNDWQWTENVLRFALSKAAIGMDAPAVGITTPTISGRDLILNASGGIGKLTTPIFVPAAELDGSTWTWSTPPDWVAVVAVATAPGDLRPMYEITIFGFTFRFPFNFDVDAQGMFIVPAGITFAGIEVVQTQPVFIHAIGTVTATSGGVVYLQETSGDMNVNTISANGEVKLTAPGSVLNASTSGANVTTPGNLTVTAGSGTIGTDEKWFNINLTGIGMLTALAQSDIYVAELTTDMNLARVASTSGNVFLMAANGSIIDAMNDNMADIYGNHVDLTATGGIGEPGDFLEIEAESLGFFAQQDIFVEDVSGDLTITGPGLMGGSTSKSMLGSVNLEAYDDFSLPADVQIWAKIQVNITALGSDVDDLGAVIDLLGLITASTSTITVTGGANNDSITIARLPLGTIMTVNALAGDDTISMGTDLVIGNWGGTATLNGGDDNDTFALVNQASFGGTLDGGAGENTLTYAQYGSPVSVTLSDTLSTHGFTGTGTGLLSGAFSNVDILVGTPFEDTFTGADLPSNFEIHVDDPDIYSAAGRTAKLFAFENYTGGADANTLDYSLFEEPVTITLSDTPCAHGFAGSGSGISGIFTNMDILFASPETDITFVGTNLDAIFEMHDADPDFYIADGRSFQLTNVDNYIGGTGRDTIDYHLFTISGVVVDLSTGFATGVDGNISGIENIIGSAQNDQLTGDGNGNEITGGGGDDQLSGLEGDDTYHFADGWGVDTLFDSDGVDTLDFSPASSNLDVDLLHTLITDANSNSLTFSGIETIYTGSGADIFHISGSQEYDLYSNSGADEFRFADCGTLAGLIDSGSDPDVLDYTGCTLPLEFRLDGMDVNGFSGMETSTLYAFAGINRIISGAALDTLLGLDLNADFTIHAGNAADVFYPDSGMSLQTASIENLVGGSGDDTFTFDDGATVNALDGGSGYDTIDLGAYSTVHIILTGTGNHDGFAGVGPGTGTFTNINNILGTINSGDRLTGYNDTATFELDGSDRYCAPDCASGPTLDLSGFEILSGGSGKDVFQIIGDRTYDLLGGAGDDTFHFADNATFTGLLDGGFGNNTLDYSAYTTARDVYLTGLGTLVGFTGTDASITGTFNNITNLIGTSLIDSLNGTDLAAVWNITATASGNYTVGTRIISFSSFETLNGSNNQDTFAIWNGVYFEGSVNGNGGSDTLDLSRATYNLYVNLTSSLVQDTTNGRIIIGTSMTSIENILGGAGNDRLIGDDMANFISGGAGNDWIEGGGNDDNLSGGLGNDHLDGGSGNDRLNGNEGRDALFGGLGVDYLIGGYGNDYLNGGAGNDRLWGSAGNDKLIGGDGNDYLRGGAGKDRLLAGNGNDKLFGGLGNDHLDGGTGNDRLWGNLGTDRLLGRNGRDRLYGGGGADYLIGNAGYDVAIRDGLDISVLSCERIINRR